MSMQTYLRLLVNGDKEAVASAISAQDTETTLTSKLTSYQRKFLTLYNNSPSGSGEAYYGFTSGELSIKNGMVLKKGEYHTVPWGQDTSGLDKSI